LWRKPPPFFLSKRSRKRAADAEYSRTLDFLSTASVPHTTRCLGPWSVFDAVYDRWQPKGVNRRHVAVIAGVYECHESMITQNLEAFAVIEPPMLGRKLYTYIGVYLMWPYVPLSSIMSRCPRGTKKCPAFIRNFISLKIARIYSSQPKTLRWYLLY